MRVQPSVEQHRLRSNWQEEDPPGYVAGVDDYTATCGPIVGLASSPFHDCDQYMLQSFSKSASPIHTYTLFLGPTAKALEQIVY
jgi:hypothetical protein